MRLMCFFYAGLIVGTNHTEHRLLTGFSFQ